MGASPHDRPSADGAAAPTTSRSTWSAEVGTDVVARVSEKRSTWHHWNLVAEASRQTMGWRFATMADREAVTRDGRRRRRARVPHALTPPELAISPVAVPARGRHERVPARGTPSCSPRPRSSPPRTGSSPVAEDRDRPDRRAPRSIERVTSREIDGPGRSAPSRPQPSRASPASGRQVDLLVGPAGAGKTTAMRALHRAWTMRARQGAAWSASRRPRRPRRCWPTTSGSRATTPPSGCTSTTADAPRSTSGQLVIVDEATLAGTLTLDRLTGLAAEAGAKVLLVGDWAQLQSVDAGGAFALLADARDDAPELTEIHRFTHEWEKHASLDLRRGRVEVIATYAAPRAGPRRHHRRDARRRVRRLARRQPVPGVASVLVTEAAHAVHELNERARAERILDGDTDPSREVTARRRHPRLGRRPGHHPPQRPPAPHAARRLGQERRPLADHRHPRRRLGRRQTPATADSAATVVLPPAYVAEHVDLGYAVTAHRAQGITVDTAHVVVTGSTTRENLYVSMTRGRDSNIAYVALDQPDDSHAAPNPEDVTARTVLFGVLQHTGVELSAHQTIEAEQERWSSIAQLAAEYETIAAARPARPLGQTSSAAAASPPSRPRRSSSPTPSGHSPRNCAEPRPTTTTREAAAAAGRQAHAG